MLSKSQIHFKIFSYVSIVVGLLLFIFILFPQIVRAEHGPGRLICDAGDSLGDGSVPSGGIGIGQFVPVRDNRAITLLTGIGANTAGIEGDTRAIRFYLKKLCEKEYIEDHDIQHAWANVIGAFVDRTRQFISVGNNGNPLFITNQAIYYQLVNLAVTNTLLLEIEASEIGGAISPELTKINIYASILSNLFETPFPYTDAANPLAPAGLAADLANGYYAAGGFDTNSKLSQPQFNEAGLINLTREDLNRRRREALQFEQEKLAWGRGFFSYELCDLAVYTTNPEDRRNCRIATPGSLIQDQTSLVFGSALRQMELNDEFEEWIAPNTLAVLSDILSDRGFNDDDSRSTASGFPAPQTVLGGGSPQQITNVVDITSTGNQGALGIDSDNPPEFNVLIDQEFKPITGGTQAQAPGVFLGFIKPQFINIFLP